MDDSMEDQDELNSFKERTPAYFQLHDSESDEHMSVQVPSGHSAAMPRRIASPANAASSSSSSSSSSSYLSDDPASLRGEHRPIRTASTTGQMRALFLKSFNVQRRSKTTICCQLIVPVILVVMVGLIQIMFNVYMNKFYTAGNPVIGSSTSIAFGRSTNMFNQYSLPTTSPSSQRTQLGELYGNGTKAGMLGHIPQYEGVNSVTGRVGLMPNFVWEASMDDVVTTIYNRKLKEVNEAYAKLGGPECPSCPASYAFFQNTTTNLLENGLSYVVGSDTQLNYYHTQTECTMINMLNNAYARFLIQNSSARSTADFSAFASAAANVDDEIISTSTTPLPYYSSIPIFDVGSSAATFLFPFAVSFLLPVYMNDIVLEKEERLRSMMVMAGLKMRLYWLVSYLYNMVLFLAIYLLLILVCVAFSLRFVTETSPTLLFLLFFAWGNAQIAFAFFLSCFFNTARIASVVGYCLVIASVLISYLLNVTIFDPLTLPLWVFMLYPPFPFYRSIFIIGLECGFFDCTTWSDLSQQPDQQLVYMIIYLYASVPLYLLLTAYFDRVFPSDTGIRSHPLFFLQPVVACFRRLRGRHQQAAGKYITIDDTDNERRPLLPSSQRQPGISFNSSNSSNNNHPTASSLVNAGRSSSSSSSDLDEVIETTNAPLLAEEVDPLYEGEHAASGKEEALEEEVRAEKDRIERGELAELVADDNIVLNNLQKVYSNGKVAVKGVSVLIPCGETFGLLGNNGAGKSTTISMLTGLFSPSSGTAYLCGYDIRHEMDSVNRILGVCPQFDCLWKELSVEETVLFYARIKGVPRSEEAAHAAQILKDIGLDHCPGRLVKELSGGMMRRLSVAVAIAADPRLIFLDEPTTGLDLVSRSELWDVLLRVKQNRCVILTTHSMSEADALCNRIAIMSDGQLQCIGSSLHLKRRFGQGYSLLVQFAYPDQLAAVSQFVTAEISPDATIRSRFDRSITYEIPMGSIEISRVFRLLTEASPRLGISDFGLSLSTLTDVFLRVSKDPTEQKA